VLRPDAMCDRKADSSSRRGQKFSPVTTLPKINGLIMLFCIMLIGIMQYLFGKVQAQFKKDDQGGG
jgi:hypothetical protein